MPTGYSKHDSGLALPICRTTYAKPPYATVHKKHYSWIVPLYIVLVKRKIEIFSVYCIFVVRLIV